MEAATEEEEEIDLRLPALEEDMASGGRQKGGYVVADVEDLGRVAGTKQSRVLKLIHGCWEVLKFTHISEEIAMEIGILGYYRVIQPKCKFSDPTYFCCR